MRVLMLTVRNECQGLIYWCGRPVTLLSITPAYRFSVDCSIRTGCWYFVDRKSIEARKWKREEGLNGIGNISKSVFNTYFPKLAPKHCILGHGSNVYSNCVCNILFTLSWNVMSVTPSSRFSLDFSIWIGSGWHFIEKSIKDWKWWIEEGRMVFAHSKVCIQTHFSKMSTDSQYFKC